MGGTLSIPNSVNVNEIINNTGLSKKQILLLWTRFYQLDRDQQGKTKGYKGYLNMNDFSRLSKFNENPIASRLIGIIFDDFGLHQTLTFAQFVNLMTTFGQCEKSKFDRYFRHYSKRRTILPTENVNYSLDDTSKLRKIKFMFRMYDIDRDGRLSKEDIRKTLQMMIGKINDDEVSIIAQKILEEFIDKQSDSMVSFEKFRQTLEHLDFDDKMTLKLLT